MSDITQHGVLQEVKLDPLDLGRFEGVLPAEVWSLVRAGMRRADRVLGDRVLWNVNSTPKGGGVAEMLQTLLAYVRGAGVDGRWMVVSGNEAFFEVTKRIHNKLHGAPGDGGPLGDAERTVYEDTLSANAEELCNMVSERDIVLLHDPQTAGLIDPVKETGATVMWRCHVGLDNPNDEARTAWHFLRPYVDGADACIFSRQAFVWEQLDTRIVIIPPSIDAFSPKNQELDASTVGAILAAAKIMEDGEGSPTYQRVDGSMAEVTSAARFLDDDDLIPQRARFVLQVSRWDRLKDPLGVMKGFADHVDNGAHLVLAGPAVEAVADDPEGKEVVEEVIDHWTSLAGDLRDRIHMLALPMHDIQENAAIVNALQRRANVVVQKSLAEGFGLTVAEAMWKARPVVASRIGGIQDQISDGETGVLIDDPCNLAEFGHAVAELIEDPERSRRLGEAAKERVRTDFLHTTHLMHYLSLFEKMLAV